MSRHVDVKALVSHIVRGDGGDKCRICMGDTSEGQVYLGDTVMLDGNNPVTLAELLETITGVTVPLEDDMPPGLCKLCTASAVEAGSFRSLCQKSIDQWEKTLLFLDNLPSPNDLPENNSALYLVIKGDEVILINEGDFNNDPDVECDEPDYESAQSPLIQSNRQKSRREICKKYFKHKGTIKCPDCGKKFKYPQHLYMHFEQSTDMRRACFVCAQVMTRDELLIHFNEEHGTIYPCKKCPAISQRHCQLKTHMAIAHKPGSHCCGECGRTFQSRHAMNAHTGIHNVKNCPSCDKIFRNQMCYRYHVKRCCELDSINKVKHKTKTKVTIEVINTKRDKKVRVGLRGSTDQECYCDYCGKKYSGKRYVAAHIQIVHMKNTHTPCTYCGKLYAKAHMTEHVKKHEEVLLLECEYCGLVLRSKLGFIQHKRLHTGELPYACKLCEAKFSSSSRRSEHVRKLHKSSEIVLKHECKFCPARFRLPYKLRKHVASVHSDEADDPRPQFQCNVCLVKFGSCRGLVHHSRKHQDIAVKDIRKPEQTRTSANIVNLNVIEDEVINFG